jgi:hypothetical protein
MRRATMKDEIMGNEAKIIEMLSLEDEYPN